MSKIRIPSVVALILGFVLFVSADQLAGPPGPNGERKDQQFVIHTAALVGGGLICVFAAAGVLYSLRKGPPRPPGKGDIQGSFQMSPKDP